MDSPCEIPACIPRWDPALQFTLLKAFIYVIEALLCLYNVLYKLGVKLSLQYGK